ncbi:MAG TPA: FHA domain-containing protein [Planctomycetota bacterium]|nr:FHA domain-containing protein [Planctomycetota bacterium]
MSTTTEVPAITRMAKLRIKDEHGKERIHELVDSITTIGRASANTIQVSDEKASRNHFRIEKLDKGFKIVDLGSTNGTRLNGNRIKGEATLRQNDQIVLGKTTFIYEDPDAPAAEPEPVSGGETIALDPKELDEKSPTLSEKDAPGPKYVLKMIEGKTPGKVYELGTAALTIGRHNSSTIQIIDDAASNYHAEINREPIGYVLTDLGSTNGTRVRHKNKSDFEKIVKTPLAPGMQIRVGKTLLEFENIGDPVDDPLFGTIQLDPDKLEAKLQDIPAGRPSGAASSGGGMGKVLAGAAALLLVFAGVVYGVVKLAGPDKPVDNTDNKDPVVLNTGNKIQNPEFDEGTDDDSNPRHFRIERGSPSARVAVIPEADREGDSVFNKNKLGLQISKGGAKNPSAMTKVETADAFPVDGGKTYEFRGWMRNDGDGLYGLHVTWIAGERTFPETLTFRGPQEWKERSMTLTPPPWAQMARAGVFAQGKEGKAYFDSLSFKEASGAEKGGAQTVKFGGVTFHFEGTKGRFTAESQGERVISDGTVVLASPDGKYGSELVTAMKPEVRQDGAKVAFTGELFDFALQEPTNYAISASPGAAGVDLRAAVDALQDTGCVPSLRFNVVGPTALGEIEISKGDGTLERLQPSEDKHLQGIRGVLFNAGKSPQLDLSFEKPVDIDLKREGAIRRVAITFKGELRLALAPESVQQKQKLTNAIADLQRALEAQRFGEAEGKVKALRDAFANRFPLAKEEADRATERLDNEWKNAREEIDRAIRPLETVATTTGVQAAKDTIQRYVLMWSASDKAATLKTDLERVNALEKSGQNQVAENAAADLLTKAENQFKSGAPNVALSFLKKLQRDYPNTAAAKKAAELLPKYEAAKQREDDLRRMTEDLMDLIKADEIAKDYKAAILKIEKSKEYQQNKADLPDVEKKLQDLRKKIGQ